MTLSCGLHQDRSADGVNLVFPRVHAGRGTPDVPALQPRLAKAHRVSGKAGQGVGELLVSLCLSLVCCTGQAAGYRAARELCSSAHACLAARLRSGPLPGPARADHHRPHAGRPGNGLRDGHQRGGGADHRDGLAGRQNLRAFVMTEGTHPPHWAMRRPSCFYVHARTQEDSGPV